MVDCEYFWYDPLVSQPRYGSVYVLGVDVNTKVVEALDVDLNLYIEEFVFNVEKRRFFSKDR